MKLTLKTIVDPNFLASYEVLSKLPLPARSSYWIARVARAINAAGQDFQEARLAVFRRIGAYDEAARQYKIDPADAGKVAELNAALGPLLAEEVDLPIAGPIPLPSQAMVAAADLMQLLDIVSLAEDAPDRDPAPSGRAQAPA